MRWIQPLVIAALLGGPAGAAAAQTPETIGVARAVAVAENAVGGRAFEVDLDNERGALVYEIDLVKDGRGVVADVDAVSGRITRQTTPDAALPFDADELTAAQSAPRTLTQTIAMVETATKGRVTDIDLEGEGGQHYYEVDLAGAQDSAVRVDLRTGAITPMDDD